MKNKTKTTWLFISINSQVLQFYISFVLFSETSVDYLRRITRGIIDRSKPLIIVAHQFTGDAIVAFNETLRQLNVSVLVNFWYHHLGIYFE